MNRHPKRYWKWVLVHGVMVTFLRDKPKSTAGGYISNFGKRWVGQDVELMSRSKFDKRYSVDAYGIFNLLETKESRIKLLLKKITHIFRSWSK